MEFAQFIEKIVIKRKDSKDYAMMAAIPVGATLAIFAILKILPVSMMAFGALLIGAVAYLMYYAVRMIYQEYEYAITVGELDIDSIRGQRKRVRVFNGQLSNIEEMGPYYPGDNMSKWDSIPVKVEAISDYKAKDIYYFIGSYKGKRTLVLFQPSHEMLAACRKYMGRKLTMRPGDEILVSSNRETIED
ncbi:MAG: hypothetical protein IKV30_01090 [Clostridia bacterium]|nr:hypothetical protein [Clostridia bacterium]